MPSVKRMHAGRMKTINMEKIYELLYILLCVVKSE